MTTQERFQRAADTFSAPLRATGWRNILAALLLVLTGCATHQRAVRAKTMLHCEFIPDDRNPVQVICPPGYYSQR